MITSVAMYRGSRSGPHCPSTCPNESRNGKANISLWNDGPRNYDLIYSGFGSISRN